MGFPNSVELLENNKGRILDDGAEILIDLKEHKILHFWDRMNELQVWKWKREYNPKFEILDGHQWELKLRNREGRTRNFDGHMSYPDNYNDFIKELNNLFGSEIKDEKYEL
jgi:hypothetical protein|tara:strand:- start:193 stop:525 length:333 start_codon:yes stop_codon:yes gene_type:complete